MLKVLGAIDRCVQNRSSSLEPIIALNPIPTIFPMPAGTEDDEEAKKKHIERVLNKVLLSFYFEKSTQKSRLNQQETIEFYHLTLMEYLAAEAIASKLLDFSKKDQDTDNYAYTPGELLFLSFMLFGRRHMSNQMAEDFKEHLSKLARSPHAASIADRLLKLGPHWTDTEFLPKTRKWENEKLMTWGSYKPERLAIMNWKRASNTTQLMYITLLDCFHVKQIFNEQLKKNESLYMRWQDQIRYAIDEIHGTAQLSLCLRQSYLSGADLSGVDLTSTDLSGTDLSHAHLKQACLSMSSLENIKLSCAFLSRADLSHTSLTNADMNGTRLNSADLSFADLEGVNLRGSFLFRADLTHANLSRADLSHSHMNFADLVFANLAGANLTGASLIGTDLSLSNLIGANLTRVNLSHANLSGAIIYAFSITQIKKSEPHRKAFDKLFSRIMNRRPNQRPSCPPLSFEEHVEYWQKHYKKHPPHPTSGDASTRPY